MKNKKKLLFIWNYFYLESEKGNSRFATLIRMLTKDFDVEVVTSSFYHMNKCKHIINKKEINALPYKITFINEPGYKKNVSFKRILSIHTFNKNVKNYLYNLNYIPDIIYIPVPSIKLGLIVNKYAKKNNSKLLVDIEDLWPESFKMIFKKEWLVKMLFFYQYHQENKLYKEADYLVAVSNTFMNRALKVRKDNPKHEITYIGSDFIKAKEELEKDNIYKKPYDEFWLTYIGTLGKSYDLKRVIDVFIKLKKDGYENIKFKILGSGPDEQILKEYVKDYNPNVEFLGLLAYGDMIRYLSISDVGINPIVPKSVASIINKVADYASVGLPVINTQNCKEYMDIIDKCKCGYNIVPFNSEALYALLIKLSKEKIEKTNTDKLAELFDRNKNYSKIIELIKE